MRASSNMYPHFFIHARCCRDAIQDETRISCAGSETWGTAFLCNLSHRGKCSDHLRFAGVAIMLTVLVVQPSSPILPTARSNFTDNAWERSSVPRHDMVWRTRIALVKGCGACGHLHKAHILALLWPWSGPVSFDCASRRFDRFVEGVWYMEGRERHLRRLTSLDIEIPDTDHLMHRQGEEVLG